MNHQQSTPTELRFDCPACQATLTVPAVAAGVQGPCPKCWQEIISPDPARNLAARLPAAPAAPTVAEEPAPREPASPPELRQSQAPLFVGLLISAVVFGLIGFYVGDSRNKPAVITVGPGPGAPVSPEPPELNPPGPGPPPTAPAPPGPSVPPAPDPGLLDQANLAPEVGLRAFLDAPDWKARAAHVLWPERVGPLMERHASKQGDGPIPFQSIEFTTGEGRNRFFQVFTEQTPGGFPVAVIATDDGPKVEWETFIGFHDDHFRRFLEGPADQTGAFDLLIWPDEVPEEGSFRRYRLRVPMPDRETLAYARKDSIATARLTALFNGSDGVDQETLEGFSKDGVPIALKLAKLATADGRSYITILEVVSVGWISGAPG